jgi:CRP-like cAMP-binding protein
MPDAFHSQDNPLIRKLESIFTLTDDERQALLDLPMQVAVIKDDQDIVREGDRPSRSFTILSGFTCTYKVTGEGKVGELTWLSPVSRREHSRVSRSSAPGYVGRRYI